MMNLEILTAVDENKESVNPTPVPIVMIRRGFNAAVKQTGVCFGDKISNLILSIVMIVRHNN